MKVKVMRPVNVDVRYLDIVLEDHFYIEDIGFQNINNNYEDVEDFLIDYPQFRYFKDKKSFWLRIDIDNGQIVNYPKNLGPSSFMDVKVVDSGTYELLDDQGNVLVTKEGYVPGCLQIEYDGYGDYFEFKVNGDGYIEKWSFDGTDYEEFEK